MMPLFRDAGEDVRLERWPASTRIELALPGGGEFFVLDGGFAEGGETFAQELLAAPAIRARDCRRNRGHMAAGSGSRPGTWRAVRGLPAAKAS